MANGPGDRDGTPLGDDVDTPPPEVIIEMSSDSSDSSDHRSDESVHDNPSFEIKLTQTHVATRYLMQMPTAGIDLLPKDIVAITLRCGRRNWSGTYNGVLVRPVINKDVWEPFVNDNSLADGDICTFKVLQINEHRGVLLKVACKYGPFESDEEVEAEQLAGTSAEHAIVLD